ncbi:odorant receptor 4-like [Colletes gigas]|uniref:odorant receptor 4-like n=1 Tax=Colletes gigas TaxID=935657 RepID=UPI001C9A59A4|nr:odorant receptor 4-like [Colletes gigas]
MFGDITVEKAITFTRLSVVLTCCWPLPSSATKSQQLRFKLVRFAMTLNAFMLLLSLLYALYVERNNIKNFTKAACLAIAVTQIVMQTIFCITQYDRLQRLIEEMIDCYAKAKRYDKYVYQQYVRKYSTFYGMSSMWFYMTATTLIAGTLFISEPFPMNTEYPFSVDYEPLRTAIFLHQALVCMQCAAHVCINMLGALLLFFAAARFEILMTELRNIVDVQDLIKGVEGYYSLKRYAQEVVKSVQLIALNTITICGVALVLCGINFIARQPFTVKVQFLCLTATALLEVFMCAWPADHLIDISQNVVQSAYESTWYEQALKMQKNMLSMLVPQKAVAIQIKCIIPVLSLSYYCSYVSNIFSLFTALRVTMMKYDDES